MNAKPPSEFTEKPHYTIAEIAEITHFSRWTVKRLFENESGVIILHRPEKLHKRSYQTVRIPRHVYERVMVALPVK